MKQITQARPYAKAAFNAAIATDDLENWQTILAMVALVAKDLQVQALLINPKVTADQKAAFFIGLCDTKLNQQQEKYVRLLAQNNRLNLFPAISLLYKHYVEKHQNTTTVKMQTAYPVNEQQQEKLKKALENKLQCHVEIAYEEDQSLLAGAVLTINDKVIDGSVRGHLSRLRNQFEE